MMKRIVGWIVLLPFCALLVVFALANRHLVAVNFNPFIPPEALDASFGVPMFLVIYAVLLIGVLLGGVATWFAQGYHRQNEKHWRRESVHLTRELEATRIKRGATDDRSLTEVDDLLTR